MKFNLFPPALIFYTDKLPNNIGGRANAFVIRIKEKYINDKGILAHELCHVKQWYFTLMFHPLLYLISKKYRLWSEVQAYKKQLKYNPEKIQKYAYFIATGYKLNITVSEALKLLEN
jgi:beta-lactamase regulating signal transducer with metallopeptidase domain